VVVRPIRLAMIGAAAFAAASVGVAAHAGTAADLFAQQNDFTPQPNQIGPQPPHRSLQWDSHTGRWGLDFEMTEPSDRDEQWRDARVGLNYRIAGGLRAGVGVSLGPEFAPDVHGIDNTGPAPRVRLQTSFKF
jgi:hypothetical protein